MRTRLLFLLGLCAAFVLPERSALACGPMPSNAPATTTQSSEPTTTTTTTNMTPRRQRWTRNRMVLIQQQQRELPRPHQTDIVDIASKAQLYQDPFAPTMAEKRREELERRKEAAAFEYLAIKKERGELTPAEARQLKQMLRHFQRPY